jgi:putative addiction module component (TIGR02574 family)
MSLTRDQIFAAAVHLPPKERARLIEQLLDSIAPVDQAQIDAAWALEIERRLDEYEAGKTLAIPAEEVFRSLDKRRKR